MNNQPSVSIVLGTRPEAIKLAPLIRHFKSCNKVKTRVVISGQHKEMVRQVMELFDFFSDYDLDLMTPNQTLTHVTSSVLNGLREEFKINRPDLVLVQGDTTTAFAAALASFYEQIQVGHVEAGLRTKNLFDPFPEEVNRRLISQIASLHFAPTNHAANNLNSSGVLGKIHVTGNTIIDALYFIASKIPKVNLAGINWDSQRVVLVTVHRRENWGEPLKQIAEGLKRVLDADSSVLLLFPIHRNPSVREPLEAYLGSHPRVFMTNPLDYDQLVGVMQRCYMLLTDSGGLQEEAPALGKPVLLLRNTTERPEAIESGTVRLVGVNPQNIFNETLRLLKDKKTYEKMSSARNPFGDGKASERILRASLEFLGV